MATPSSSPAGGPEPSAHGARIGSRDRTFLVAKNDRIDPASAGPLDFDFLLEQLHADRQIHVETTIVPRSVSLQRFGESVVRQVVVATMPEEKARDLMQHPQVVLEEDQVVVPVPLPVPAGAVESALLFSPFGTSTEWQIDLRTPAGGPVANATVYLYGSGIPAQGRTDASGRVTLSLLNESDSTLRALYVNPESDVWSMWVDRPALISGVVNTVTLVPLDQQFPGFPAHQLTGWGQQAMGLDRVPRTLDGRGVRVGVVDSGAAAATHPDLRAIRQGLDVTTIPASPTGWDQDTIAHGSHCSGIIAGADNGSGIRGFAPAATMFEARIFPGGRLSSLLDALDYCIDQQMDVVNMSLGTGGTSQIVLEKLAQARQEGVACIVAAGNSGDAVQFPGTSPDVLTVAAIGQDGQFPASSYHAKQRWSGGREDQGFFSAQFSCHGPEVDVCGPGVAIVSSVPAAGFAAWDGTSMATPHVTGLAALVLAHHPDFATPAYKVRSAAKVDRLFEILRGSARPFSFGDPSRSGAGLPDAVRALALDGGAPAVSTPGGTQAVRQLLEQLRQQLVEAGLGPAHVSVNAPPAGYTPIPFVDTARSLLILRSQMTAAGLPVAVSRQRLAGSGAGTGEGTG